MRLPVRFTASALLVALFVVLVLGCVAICFTNFAPQDGNTFVSVTAPQKQSGGATVPSIPFTDVTEKSGITFKHFNGAYGRKLLPETMGSGVAVLDYDNDGKPDILFINSRPWPGESGSKPEPTMALYHNLGEGRFEDVTAQMGLNVPLYGMGVCCGDYDNDGWIDIFVTAIGGCKLFRNVGGKRFVDVTAEARVGGPGEWPAGLTRAAFEKLGRPMPWPTSATFLDFDGDGKLDLFVCHYLTWSPAADIGSDFKLEGGGPAYGPPYAFEGTQCVLYRNIDGRTFEDVSERAGIRAFEPDGRGPNARPRPVAKALGVVACDPDEDGWPDIVVANDTSRNFFFHNVPGPNGERRFEEQGLAVGMAYAGNRARGGMGIDWGEFRPGEWAVMVANFADEPTSFLVRQNAKRLSFVDISADVGIAIPSRAALKFGTFFADFDLDGRLDILTNNGHLEPDIARARRGETYAQSPELFWNTGRKGGGFEPATAKEAGEDLLRPLVGRGSAFADFHGTGRLDVVLTANGGPARLLRNDCDLKNHWVRLTLEGDGRRSNRSAIGAVATLEAGGEVQRRVVTGARGYLSQSELTLTFGLGKTTKIDKVTVRWPGKDAGPPTVLNDLAIDRVHVI
jgi:hypothetical protein